MTLKWPDLNQWKIIGQAVGPARPGEGQLTKTRKTIRQTENQRICTVTPDIPPED